MDEHEVVLRTMLLTFHPDTLELDIDAPNMSLDFGISLLERAKRLLEHQEKITVVQQAAATARADAANQDRTKEVLSRIKLH
jgi:hypothetical protein